MKIFGVLVILTACGDVKAFSASSAQAKRTFLTSLRMSDAEEGPILNKYSRYADACLNDGYAYLVVKKQAYPTL